MSLFNTGMGLTTLVFSTLVVAGDLTATLDNINLLEGEKTAGPTLITPKISVEGKSLRETVVRIQPGESVSMAIPTGKDTANLIRVYFDDKTGGVFISEASPAKTRFLKLYVKSAKTPLTLEQRTERNFIRQFAYVLRQRHPQDPGTVKYLNRYFPVVENEIEKTTVFDISRPLTKKEPIEKVFHLMEKPATWKGKECTAERCLYEHPEFGTLTLSHPGAADLIFDEDELVDPEEEKLPLAPHIASKIELEKKLEELPEEVGKVFVLITHEHCGPCQTLKKSGSSWAKICRQIRKAQRREISALMEHSKTEAFAPSTLMETYGLPAGYPQLLVFERDESGRWNSPRQVSAGNISTVLK